jgi:hypothetical protein
MHCSRNGLKIQIQAISCSEPRSSFVEHLFVAKGIVFVWTLGPVMEKVYGSAKTLFPSQKCLETQIETDMLTGNHAFLFLGINGL